MKNKTSLWWGCILYGTDNGMVGRYEAEESAVRSLFFIRYKHIIYITHDIIQHATYTETTQKPHTILQFSDADFPMMAEKAN